MKDRIYWTKKHTESCYCYTIQCAGSGCDVCASLLPRVYLPPGEERNEALAAVKEMAAL